MIKDTILNRIVHSSGIEDASIVRLDVMAVYLLQGLSDAGMFSHMCFKGGNSLRKIFARRPSRFSRDTELVKGLRERFSFLSELTEKETELCKDRWNKKRDLHNELWDGCKKVFEASKDR